MMDTGGGAIVLSGKMFRRIQASAKETGYFTGFRHDADRIDGIVYTIPSFGIGEVIDKNVKLGVYPPLDKYGVDGLISLKFFEDKPFSIDFKNQKLKILNAKELEEIKKDQLQIPVFLKTHTDFTVDMFIEICLNESISVQAEFDTGSGFKTLIVNPYFIKKLNLDSKTASSRGYKTPISKKSSMDSIFTISKVQLCALKDENLGLSDKETVFREGLIYEALIGSEMFKEKTITIDINGKRMFVD